MTATLLVLAALLVGLLAYRLARLPAALRARDNVNAVTAQALLGDVPVMGVADSPADMPWVAQLSAVTAGRGVPTTGQLGAGDWYDPTVSSYPQTFNEFGFITSPSPAPVNPKTGTVPLTNADVCSWVGHMPPVNGACPRCGVAVT